ncbi:MAG: 6,7-dimethyl-8-ribityllumazine synthase [Verrucomicrobiales bacterium]
MSSTIPPKPRTQAGQKHHICIVASEFNETFTDALVENTIDELNEILPAAKVDLFRVPGAYEVPLATKAVLDKEKPDCVIALGLIIRGSTAHGDLVAQSVTTSLQQLSLDHLTPVIHEVLLVDDDKQAYARCIGSKLNRGREAARSAAGMIEVMAEILQSKKSIRLHPRNA